MESTKVKDARLLTIGKKIRAIRKSNPQYKNYEVFAFSHGINKVTLSNLEKGENFTMESLLKVLDSLGIKLSAFFNDID